MHPDPAARRTMGIISNFMESISEDARWSGRTQSGASWSPEQLRRDLRRQVEILTVEHTMDAAPTGHEIPMPRPSSVRV